MDSNPIITKLTNKPTKLNFDVKKKKGEPDVIVMPINQITEESTRYYYEAKNLKPFGEYKEPYWSIIEILEPTFTRSKFANEKQYTHFNKETEYLYKKYMPVNLYNEIIYNNIGGFETYSRYLTKSPKSFLFLTNNYYQEYVENLFFFREKTSIYSVQDTLDYVVIEDFLISPERKRDYKYLDSLKEKYSNFDLIISNNNVCETPEVDNLKDTYNTIFLSGSFFYWPLKHQASYMSSQFIFNLIIVSFKKLSKKGNLFMSLKDINSQLTLDIIAILNYYFEEIELFKGTLQATTRYVKTLVAKNFKGITQNQYNDLLEVSKKWHNIQQDCFVKTTKFSDDKYYVRSILNYQGNLSEIQSFQIQEDAEKVIFFNNIVTTYNALKLGGDKKLKKLIDKKIYQSISILNSLGIFKKINVKKLEKEITSQEVSLKYETNMFKFNKGTKNSKLRIKVKPINFAMDNIEEMTNRLKVTKRTLDNIPESQFEDIIKKLKKFITLGNVLESKYTLTKTGPSFIKLFEILKMFNLLDTQSKIHKTFHLCEAPAQFIIATNHYLKTETKNKTFDWTGQSLIGRKPFKDIYDLVKKYPTHWDFGPDRNGDITQLKNIKYYGTKKDMDLVTFDCGFNFEDKTVQIYQDNFTAMLNYSQVLILLQSLKKGGSFVVRVFLPQSIPYIISINYILYCCFKELYLYKPFVNPEASEIYIIGRGFKGVEEKLIKQLMDVKNKLNEEDILLNIPLDFLKEYERGIQKFVEANIENITNIVYLSKNKKILSDKSELSKIRDKNTQNWIKYFDIKKIKKSDLL